jgi:hypothetical protein
MKSKTKSWLATLLLLALAFGLNAQEGWRVGLSLQPFHYFLYNKTDYQANDVELPPGVEQSVFIVDDQSLFKPTGFGAGLVLERGMSERFSLRSELGWSRQEQMYYIRYPNNISWKNAANYSTRLDYLKIPILAVFKLSSDGISGIELGFGGQVSLLSNA